MTNEEIFNKQVEILRRVFNNDSLEVTRETNANDIEEWDSLTHITLIGETENEFKIRFALGELQKLKNVGDMTNLIESKLNS
jgi:acyl carrier protein